MGVNMMPKTKKTGSVFLGVKMGCHARNLCCKKAPSFRVKKKKGEGVS